MEAVCEDNSIVRLQSIFETGRLSALLLAQDVDAVVMC